MGRHVAILRARGRGPARRRDRRSPAAIATLTANLYLVVGSSVLGPGGDRRVVDPTAAPPFVLGRARLGARAPALERSQGPRHAVAAAALPPQVVFMANHQSLYDIAALLATVPVPVRFLAKRSLFRLPFFGWGLAAAGFVPIDRVDRSRAKEAFRHALERARGRDGDRDLPRGDALARRAHPALSPRRLPDGAQGQGADRSGRHPRHPAGAAQGPACWSSRRASRSRSASRSTPRAGAFAASTRWWSRSRAKSRGWRARRGSSATKRRPRAASR